MSERERLGKDYKPASREDAATIEEGVRAWSRLKKNSVMQDWLAVGKALLCGRKLCLAQVRLSIPSGSRYGKAYAEWLKAHNFHDISKRARNTAMTIVENLVEIEAFLVELSDDKRTALNNPQVIWNAFTAHRRGESDAPKHWHDKTLSEERFNLLFEAISDTSETGDALVVSIAACRALGFAVPKEILRDKEPYRRLAVTVRPALPWSPFELRL